jgi:hypothetical protein
MNDSIKKVCFLVSLIAVSMLCWEISAYGQPNVQVVKDDFGVERVVFTQAQSDVSIMSVARRLNPDFTLYDDLTGDGIADIITCAENQGNGQIRCQTINTATKTVMANINILTPAYLAGNYLTIYDFNADSSYDGLGCGIRLSDGAVECQIKDLKTGASVGVGQFVAIPPGADHDGYLYSFSYSTYTNIDGDSDTREISFCWTKATDQQMYCRVLNPLTGAALTPDMKVLTPNYDLYSYSASFSDVNYDGNDELVACARNRVSGQFVCQVKNGLTGALIKNIHLMTSSDYVADYTWADYAPAFTGNEIMACGWNTSTKQPRCEIKKLNDTLMKSINVLSPSFVP